MSGINIEPLSDIDIKPETIETIDVVRNFPRMSNGKEGIIIDPWEDWRNPFYFPVLSNNHITIFDVKKWPTEIHRAIEVPRYLDLFIIMKYQEDYSNLAKDLISYFKRVGISAEAKPLKP